MMRVHRICDRCAARASHAAHEPWCCPKCGSRAHDGNRYDENYQLPKPRTRPPERRYLDTPTVLLFLLAAYGTAVVIVWIVSLASEGFR